VCIAKWHEGGVFIVSQGRFPDLAEAVPWSCAAERLPRGRPAMSCSKTHVARSVHSGGPCRGGGPCSMAEPRRTVRVVGTTTLLVWWCPAMLPPCGHSIECEVDLSSCGTRLPSVRATMLVTNKSIMQAPGQVTRVPYCLPHTT
jgi:hypothetical protein